ncbi:glycosyltransferase [Patescibacteria group bacterium]|nr:glycosyltransferase [Patescibacteria group bacterium]MBU1682873.1 glycosyltransferase [Patescibacteria group bacterium]MBU1935739.1 glycosyltransferase [Patescibacteria group bacterium]
MKIALVHEMLTKLGGAERVLRTLSDMYPKSPIYTLLHDAEKTEDWFGDKTIHPSYLQTYYRWLKSPKWLLSKMPKAIEQFDFSDYDVVISSSSAFAHGIKTNKKTKHICYCHSPMRYAWDYTHEYTKNYSGVMKFLIANLLKQIRIWDFKAASNPDLIVANSKHVQKRIEKYWRKKSTVIYPPVEVGKFKPTADCEDYFLIVSALTPFKKIDLAVHAFNKLKRRLVIIGDGAQRKSLESIANDNIEFLGYKPDSVVREYMQNCRAFIFPGEEDFGITPAEAMAAGKPVLAYGIGGVTESVQEGVSGEFFHKLTSESLIEGLTRLMMNEKRYDYKKIRQIAEKFDESVFEEKIKKVVENK